MKTVNLEQNSNTICHDEATQIFIVDGSKIAVHYPKTDISERMDIFESIRSILFSQAAL